MTEPRRYFATRPVISEATVELDAAGVASPRVDAELLAAHVLGVPRGRLVLTEGFDDEHYQQFRALVRKRAERVPLQHLVGMAPFRHLELAVGPGVFIPRPETELLVGWGLDRLAQFDCARPTVVDLCAGSGAIALAVAQEYPAARVYAVERDPAALEWLRRNAAGTEVTIVEGDATDPGTLAELDSTVDLVLRNPPYVPEIGAAGLPAEVTRHDPHQAVFGGVDGLTVIRPLITRVAALLRPGGAVGIEHDDTQSIVVTALLYFAEAFDQYETHRDLGGRPRFTSATRRP
jgi:release factor glutamine methyltransferase